MQMQCKAFVRLKHHNVVQLVIIVKNNILIQKSLKNGNYLDPDIAAMASQIMQQGIKKPL